MSRRDTRLKLIQAIVDASERCEPGKNDFFGAIIRFLDPVNIVELGTGAGATAPEIMRWISKETRFTTINWPNPPSGDPVGIRLAPWAADKRLTQLLGDTRDLWIVEQVPHEIDLLYIDSGTTHEYALIAAEWKLYRPLLADLAVVVCDDIEFPGSDMERFWDEIPYPKWKFRLNGVMAAIFLYERKKGQS